MAAPTGLDAGASPAPPQQQPAREPQAVQQRRPTPDLVSNAGNWLRILFHSAVCQDQDACTLGRRCSDTRRLLAHLIDCEPVCGCSVPSCQSLRGLLQHYVACAAPNCVLCMGIVQDLMARREDAPPEPAQPPAQPSAAPDSAPSSSTLLDSCASIGASSTAASVHSAATAASSSGCGRASAEHQLSDFGVQQQEATSTDAEEEARAAMRAQVVSMAQWLLHSLFGKAQMVGASPSLAAGRALWFRLLQPDRLQAPVPGVPMHRVEPRAAQGAQQEQAQAAEEEAQQRAVAVQKRTARRVLKHVFTCTAPTCWLCTPTMMYFKGPAGKDASTGGAPAAEMRPPAGTLEAMEEMMRGLAL